MPLMKRRSKKAFEHNVKAEMHAGKPQDQSIAIAYSVKRRAKKAKGGEIKGINRQSDVRQMGTSEAGHHAKYRPSDKDMAYSNAQAKKHHEQTLSEMRSMPKPKLPMAEGGGVHAANKKYRQRHGYEEGVHHAVYDLAENQEKPGQSSMGSAVRNKDMEAAKRMSIDKKKQARNVAEGPSKRPLQGLAEGGFIDPQAYSSASANQRPGKLPIKHPRIVKGASFSSRLRDEEDDLEMSARPNNGPEHQPPHEDDEMGPDRQGPHVSDMEDEHSTHRKPYAKGGEVEQSDYSHPENECEDDLLDLPPSEDEGDMMAEEHDEEGQDRQGPDDEALHMKMMAEGGMMDDSEDQPHDEEELEHAASIAAAIMAKKRRKMAEGGAIKSHDSIYSDDSDQADLSRNADEDANEEDQLSFNALRKENYSESAGLRKLDSPEDSNEHSPEHDEEDVDDADIVSAIRRKMRMRSKITK